LRLDILVKRSQVDLNQLMEILSGFFELRTVVGRWWQWLEGTQLPDPDEEVGVASALVRIRVPLADMEEKGRISEWVSRHSSAVYRLRLANVGRKTLLAIVGEMEARGLDVGFVERRGGRYASLSGETIIWPMDADARHSTATRLHEASKEYLHAPMIDLDFFILSLRSISRRKLRTAFLVAVLSLVCANFIYHVNFSISGEGVSVLVPEQWELPFAAGIMVLITFLNLMEISLHERKVEIGTIRALGCETTTTVMIFAAEGMILGALGALVGYAIVIIIALSIRFLGIDPGLDLVAVAGPGKAILGLFLGLLIGVLGTVPLIFPMVWRPPENCL
jgi:hypothetical protein